MGLGLWCWHFQQYLLVEESGAKHHNPPIWNVQGVAHINFCIGRGTDGMKTIRLPQNGGDVNITCIIDNKLVLFPSAEKETLDTLPNYTCF